MFERLTDPAREVIVRSRGEANALGHGYVGTEHLLMALLDEEAGEACTVLRQAGVGRQHVRAEILRLIGAPAALGEDDAAALETIGIDLAAVLARIEESYGSDTLQPPLTPRLKKVLELSLREAQRLKHDRIGPGHMLLGLVREGEGLAAKILTEAGVSLDLLRDATLACLRDAA